MRTDSRLSSWVKALWNVPHGKERQFSQPWWLTGSECHTGALAHPRHQTKTGGAPQEPLRQPAEAQNAISTITAQVAEYKGLML